MRNALPLVLLLAAAACAHHAPPAPPAVASAEFVSFDGRKVGEAHLVQTSKGVRITAEFAGIAPGTHALHIHAAGACAAPFTTAGPHFNPGARKHGLHNPDGAHAGDLPNIVVPISGAVKADTTTSAVTLLAGPTSLFDADGSSLVLHDAADDYVTDPAGNAGKRIACAVIVNGSH